MHFVRHFGEARYSVGEIAALFHFACWQCYGRDPSIYIDWRLGWGEPSFLTMGDVASGGTGGPNESGMVGAHRIARLGHCHPSRLCAQNALAGIATRASS